MNLLTAINKKYLPYFTALVRSFADNNPGEHTVYVATKEVTEQDIEQYRAYIPDRVKVCPVAFCDDILEGAPTERRWPKEIYYRIFAAGYLPESVDRVLYMDSDIIVKVDISDFYNTDFEDNFFVATTNVHSPFLKWFIRVKNGAEKNTVYVNTGVLLMNLEKLRQEQSHDEVLSYIDRRKFFLTLPDQDVISTLYGHKIKIADGYVYNLNERKIRGWNRRHSGKDKIKLGWVDENAKIIHYLGRNKPWNEKYKGILKPYYDKYKVK
ncbi:MAG: glycosyltransferase family 8 protein [Clostridia bacterium]|nr:glycosyltransferase family 8 protein [Clostridia bacterium]